jgi:hypothetical protein
MLLSLNLSLLREAGHSFTLNQRIHITGQNMSAMDRARAWD